MSQETDIAAYLEGSPCENVKSRAYYRVTGVDPNAAPGAREVRTTERTVKDGDVLKTGDFNKDYFTQIDIRTVKEIKLYSKSAEMLTNHPAGSYTLQKDQRGEYVLRITDPNKFWSVSKYLVIKVK